MIDKGTMVEVSYKNAKDRVEVEKLEFRVDKGNKMVFADPQTELEKVIPVSRIIIVNQIRV